jgi:proteasome activator subunit 4
MFLGRSERTYFVNVLLKLIDRGQYSKDEHLSETVAAATSILSYVEPTLVLPFLASRFHLALETVSSVACVVLWIKMLKYGFDPGFKGSLLQIMLLSSH